VGSFFTEGYQLLAILETMSAPLDPAIDALLVVDIDLDPSSREAA
jgi:hypothetical protein